MVIMWEPGRSMVSMTRSMVSNVSWIEHDCKRKIEIV
jgi:hypothetical protein